MGNCFEPASKKESLESSKWGSCTMDEFEKRVNPLIDNIKGLIKLANAFVVYLSILNKLARSMNPRIMPIIVTYIIINKSAFPI